MQCCPPVLMILLFALLPLGSATYLALELQNLSLFVLVVLSTDNVYGVLSGLKLNFRKKGKWNEKDMVAAIEAVKAAKMTV